MDGTRYSWASSMKTNASQSRGFVLKHARNLGTCALGLHILEVLLILGIEARLELFHCRGRIELLLAYQ